ncbi:MAG: family 20 glycosylhydrolase [Clostridiales bacterium]|nr:family 20 glycosylhydrolase [Clostridiales bacterium]
MYLTRLYPSPKTKSETSSGSFSFGSSVRGRLVLPKELPYEVIDSLKYLWHRFSFTASNIEFDICNLSSENVYKLVIGNGADISLKKEEEYAIKSDSSGVTLAAWEKKGFINGFKTLIQLICPNNLAEGEESLYIESVEIHDSPSLNFRGIHLCVFPDSKLSTIEKAIRLAGLLKLTHVILEFWGTYRFDCLKSLSWEGYSYGYNEIKPLMNLARSLDMEVIPMLNHFGHATASRVSCGRHVVLNSDLRYAKLFEPDGWTFCISNPDTRKLLSAIREELYDLCGEGNYIHLGFDEAYSFATCPECRKHEPSKLLAEYLNYLSDDCLSHGRRPIIWHDELIDRNDFPAPKEGYLVANGQNRGTSKALDLLDKRIIIADWQYGYLDETNPTSEYFQKAGFDVIACPFDNNRNIAALSVSAKKLNLFGVLLTTWHHLPDYFPKLPAAASMLWEDENCRFNQNWTETASLLRMVYDVAGDYKTAGWSMQEVDG